MRLVFLVALAVADNSVQPYAKPPAIADMIKVSDRPPVKEAPRGRR